MVKYKYIFQIKYTERILANSTQKLLWFEITKMLIAVKKVNLLCYLLSINQSVNFQHTFHQLVRHIYKTLFYISLLTNIKIYK